MNLLLRAAVDHQECGDHDDVAQTCQLLQRVPCVGGQPGQSADHQVHDIFGVPLGLNALEVPAPAPCVMVEADQALFGQGPKELNHEERVPRRLVMYQLRQRRGDVRFTAKSIGNQVRDVFAGKWRQRDLLDLRASVLDGIKLAPQWMSGIDLVVAKSADQHQVPQIRSGEQVLDQVERCCVEPLQVIEEQHQRMFRTCEYADKSSEHEVEAALCLPRRNLGDRRLFSYDQLQFGDQVDDKPAIWDQGLMKGSTPACQLGVTLAQQRPHE